MSDKEINDSERTAERLRQFHEEARRTRTPREAIHSDKLLVICACIIAIGGIFTSFYVCPGIEALIGSFISFTVGVFFYTVARIYTTLREIRDNQYE